MLVVFAALLKVEETKIQAQEILEKISVY